MYEIYGEAWYDACDYEDELRYSDFCDFKGDYSPKSFKTAIAGICEVEEILAEYEDFIDESSVECLIICEALEDYAVADIETLKRVCENIDFKGGSSVEFDGNSILLRVYGS